jgi:hypothetical protein
MNEGDIEVDFEIDEIKQDEKETDAIDYETLKETPEIPEMTSPDWSAYVMSHLEEDEVYEIVGTVCPSSDGLRRVMELLIGPIISCEIIDHVAPNNSNNMSSTVVVRITVYVKNEDHPLHKHEIFFDEIVNVGGYNTKEPYSKHQSATAKTKAEGRAYKKILRLTNVQTVEEVRESSHTDLPDETKTITDSQIGVIDRLCSRIDIDVVEFINSGKHQYDSVKNILFTNAAIMIQTLNKIQRGTKDKPKLNKYNKEWRNE